MFWLKRKIKKFLYKFKILRDRRQKMKILLVVLLAFTVSCATTGKNPIEVIGTSKLSESNAGIAISVAFDDAMKKLNIAKCKFFQTISVCIFPNKDKVEIILRGSECNPPKIAGR